VSTCLDYDAIGRRIGIIDLHNDLPLALLKRRFDGIEGSLSSEWLPRLRAGGVNVVVCASYVDDVFLPEGSLRRAVQLVDALIEEVALCHESFGLAVNHPDIERINAEGKIALMIAFEGAEPLGHDLSGLRLFQRLGLRMLSFTWMRRTAFGDGTWENESQGGLTRLGKQAVREMNRLGIMVDVSHASDPTIWDILSTSTRPVIASHCNARTVFDHPRNLSDDMIRAIVQSGGLIGVVAASGYISATKPSVSQWVDHVNHIVDLVGIDHVAIGCDFYEDIASMGALLDIPGWSPGGGFGQPPMTDMKAWKHLPNLTAELLRQDYDESALRKIYRENFLNVLDRVA
jgi:membrane dipeptidase